MYWIILYVLEVAFNTNNTFLKSKKIGVEKATYLRVKIEPF